MRCGRSCLIVAAAALNFLGAACGGADATRHDVASDSAGVRIVEVAATALRALPQWKLDSAPLKIAEDESSAGTLLHLAGMPWRLSDGRIVIPNEQYEIRYYDPTGRFLKSAGRRGDGPGDFRQLWTVYPVENDSLLVLDAYGPPVRVSVFDPAGRFVRIHGSAPNVTLTWLPDRSAAFLDASYPRMRARMDRGGWGRFQDTTLLIRTSPDFKLRDTLARVPGEWLRVFEDRSWTGVNLAGQALFTAGPSGIVAGNGEAFDLRWFDTAGKLARIVRVALEPEPVTDAAIARHESIQRRGRRLPREGPVIAPDYAKTLPLVSRIRMDRVGRLWVRRWVFDDEREAEWIVFDSDGTPLARMMLPGTFTFADAGEDYVLGRYTNEDGVQSIRRYRLPP